MNDRAHKSSKNCAEYILQSKFCQQYNPNMINTPPRAIPKHKNESIYLM